MSNLFWRNCVFRLPVWHLTDSNWNLMGVRNIRGVGVRFELSNSVIDWDVWWCGILRKVRQPVTFERACSFFLAWQNVWMKEAIPYLPFLSFWFWDPLRLWKGRNTWHPLETRPEILHSHQIDVTHRIHPFPKSPRWENSKRTCWEDNRRRNMTHSQSWRENIFTILLCLLV